MVQNEAPVHWGGGELARLGGEESFGHEWADFYFVLFPHVCFDHFCLGANMDATSQMHRGVDLVRDMLISLAVGL